MNGGRAELAATGVEAGGYLAVTIRCSAVPADATLGAAHLDSAAEAGSHPIAATRPRRNPRRILQGVAPQSEGHLRHLADHLRRDVDRHDTDRRVRHVRRSRTA